MKSKYGEYKEYNYDFEDGHLKKTNAPGYDRMVYLNLVRKGRHKGKISVEVGSFPQPGHEVGKGPYSTFGKKKTRLGYVDFQDLKSFIEEVENEFRRGT